MSVNNDTQFFGRVLTAMVTPFDGGGKVDYEAAARLARHLADNGSDGLVVSGTTGESPTLTSEEKVCLFRTIRQAVAPNVRVLAGTGSYDTAETIHLSQEAEKAGVDGLLLVTPYYNRPSQAGMYAHFRAVAESVKVPIMLYNVPPRTAVNLEAATVFRLAEISNIVAIKEASKSMEQVAEIILGTPDNFAVYSGDDGVTLPILALGGAGVVSVTSHVAGPNLHEMHTKFFAGDLAAARAIHLRTIALTKALFSVPSPVPTKTALQILGVLPNCNVRLPLIDADESERAAIQSALKEYGLLSS